MEKTGKAYGFFYYAGDKPAIQKELPAIRKTVETPLEMTVSVKKIDSLNTRGDSALAGIVGRAKDARMNYVLEADSPGMSNARTATEVQDVLGGIRLDAVLYSQKEPFCAEVVYQRGEDYVFKR